MQEVKKKKEKQTTHEEAWKKLARGMSTKSRKSTIANNNKNKNK